MSGPLDEVRESAWEPEKDEGSGHRESEDGVRRPPKERVFERVNRLTPVQYVLPNTGRDGSLGTMDDVRLAKLHMSKLTEKEIRRRRRRGQPLEGTLVQSPLAYDADVDDAEATALATGGAGGRPSPLDFPAKRPSRPVEGESEVMTALRARAAVSRTVKMELQLRGLSLATPNKVGAARDEALRKRLILALDREGRRKLAGPYYKTEDRIAHYRNVRNEQLNKDMEWALQDDDYDRLRGIMDRGGNPEHVMRNGQTAFNRAVLYQETGFVRYLQTRGVSMDLRDAHGDTPLVTAARAHLLDMVSTLVEMGANPDAEAGLDPDMGITPLMAACRVNSTAIIQALLEKGANVDYQNKSGITALMYSIKWRQVEAARLLLLKGASRTIKDNWSRSAVWWAREEGVPAMIHLLTKGGARRRGSAAYASVLAGLARPVPGHRPDAVHSRDDLVSKKVEREETRPLEKDYDPVKDLDEGRRHIDVLRTANKAVSATIAFQRAGRKRAKQRLLDAAKAAADAEKEAGGGGDGAAESKGVEDSAAPTDEKKAAPVVPPLHGATPRAVAEPKDAFEAARLADDRRQVLFAKRARPIVTKVDEEGRPIELGMPVPPPKKLDPLNEAARRASWEGVLHPPKPKETEAQRAEREAREKAARDAHDKRQLRFAHLKEAAEADAEAAKGDAKAEAETMGGGDADTQSGSESEETESEGEKEARLAKEKEDARKAEIAAAVEAKRKDWADMTEEEKAERVNEEMALEERDTREHEARLIRKAKWKQQRIEANKRKFEREYMEYLGAKVVPFQDEEQKRKEEEWWKTDEERAADEKKVRTPRVDDEDWDEPEMQIKLRYEKIVRHRKLSMPEAEAEAEELHKKRGRRGAFSKHEAHGRIAYEKCQYCHERIARLRCINCAQILCETCTVAIHRQESRRHHHVKPLHLKVTTEDIQVREARLQPKSSLEASVGTATDVMKKLHNMLYAGLGLMDMEDEVAGKKQLFAESAERRAQRKRMKITEARKVQQARTKAKLDSLYEKPAEVSFARFLVTHGRYSEAEKLLREILAGQERQLGKTVMPVARTLLVAARLHEKQEQWSFVSDDLSRALQIMMVNLPPMDADVLDAQERLSEALCKQERFREAETLWEEALGQRQTKLDQLELKMGAPSYGADADEMTRRSDRVERKQYREATRQAAVNMLEMARRAEVKDMGAEDFRNQERLVRKEARLARRAARQARRDEKLKGKGAGEDDSSTESDSSDDSDNFEYDNQGKLRRAVRSKYQINISVDPDTLRAVLATERWLAKFYRFCKKEKSQAGIGFLVAINEYKQMSGSGPRPAPGTLPNPATDRTTRATAIWARYIKPQGILPAVPMSIRNKIAEAISIGVRANTFNDAYDCVFELVLNTNFKRYMDSEKGRRFAYERALAMGLLKWDVEAIGWLASRKRVRLVVRAQAVVRGYVARVWLAREAAWAQRQRELARMHALRSEALGVAKYIVRQIMGRMDLLAGHRVRVAKEAARRMVFRTLHTGKRLLGEREQTPLERGVSRFRRRVLREAFAMGRSAVWRREKRRRDDAFQAANSIYAHGVAAALIVRRRAAGEEPLPKRLVREYIDEHGLVPSDSDSDGEGLRQETSTAVRRRTWNYARRLRWASRMVQRHWRGYTARRRIRELINTIYVKRFDKASQRWYFVDTRDGSIRWMAPHSGQITAKIMCIQCDLRPATRQCLDCEDAYCTEDFPLFHKGNRMTHQYIEITPDHLVCPYCNLKLQTRWCTVCGEGACQDCHEKRHPKGPKKGHEWRALFSRDDVRQGVAPKSMYCDYCRERAVRVYCHQCQDKFCVECYQRRHEKGKRQDHTWEEFVIPSPDEAASKLQKAYRSRNARRLIRSMLKAMYSRGYDEDSGTWYYISNITGEARWTKPARESRRRRTRTPLSCTAPRNVAPRNAASHTHRARAPQCWATRTSRAASRTS